MENSRGRRRSTGSSVLTPPVGIPAQVTGIPEQRAAEQRTPGRPVPVTPPTPPAAAADPTVCTCGHPAEAHEHLRPGHDCGACGRSACASYRPAHPETPLRRLRRALRRD